MTLFLTILGASALGTFFGTLGLFSLIGEMARRQERKQLQELQRLQQGYLEMVEREKNRMENYARMEG